jgi:hypothetical protein
VQCADGSHYGDCTDETCEGACTFTSCEDHPMRTGDCPEEEDNGWGE